MDIDLVIPDTDEAMQIYRPKDLSVKRWDWIVNDVKCNTSCELIIRLYCDNDVPDENMPLGWCVKNIVYKLEGEEYSAWGVDDDYITQIALREINKISN